MDAACPFPLEGKDRIDLPSQEQQALKTEKALRHLRAYIERCGGTLPQSWDCALRFRTTTRRNGRLGLTTDNFYYSPCGKTFRTHRQVAEFLGLSEPQQEQPQYIVTVPGQQQHISSTPAARVPTDPRVRPGMKRAAPSTTAAASCGQEAKRSALSATSSCTSTGLAASDSAQDAQQVLAPAAIAAIAATSISVPSCCSKQQQPGMVEQSAQSMPPPPPQPVRRTKGSLAAKYAGIGTSAGTLRSSVAINTTGSFYDLCFSLVAAGSGSAQAPAQQQQHLSIPPLVSVVSRPLNTPPVVQQQQQVVITAAAPCQHVATQKQQPALAPATARKLQQQTAAVSPASSSTSSSTCTADSDLQTAPVDSKNVSPAHKQRQEEELLCVMPAKVAVPILAASTAAGSECGTSANTAACSSLTSSSTVSNSNNSCMLSSLAVAPVITKQRSSKIAAKSKDTVEQQRKSPSRLDPTRQQQQQLSPNRKGAANQQQQQSPIRQEASRQELQLSPNRKDATKQQQQGPKPWKPRAQPAWRLQLRQLASQIAAEKAAASSSRSTAAADSAVSGATVQ